MPASDIALIGADLPAAVRQLLVALRLGVLMDDSSHVTGKLRQCHRDVGGVHIAILRMEEPALDVWVGLQQRMFCEHLFGRQDLHVDCRCLGNADIGQELVHPFGGIRKGRLPDLVQTDRGCRVPFPPGCRC